MTHAVATLYAEELRATMRGRFAWLGAAVVLLGLGIVATVGTQDVWLDGFGIVAYGVVPLGFLPLSAGLIASARANRFVESVFTAPVERRDWLAAKMFVLVTLAAGYCAALVPMTLVYIHHVGAPLRLQKFLMWTPGVLVASIAVGVLIGVLFIGRSIAAPAATAMGVLLVYLGCAPLQELLVAQGNGATRTGHLVLLSPAVLLKSGLGFTLVAAAIPATTILTWCALTVLVAGALSLAIWTFLRAQGVETWEASVGQRWTIALAIVGLQLLPVLIADTNYDRAAPPVSNAPPVRGVFARGASSLALVAPGAAQPSRCCSPVLNRDLAPLGTDERSRRDLLLLLPVESTQRVTDLRLTVVGEAGLDITTESTDGATVTERLEKRAYSGDLGPAAADGRHIGTGWVARMPVTLNPTRPWDIGGNRYPLTVSGTYRVAGEDQPRTIMARGAVDAAVSPALYEMGVSAGLLPLICLGAAFRRWRRTR